MATRAARALYDSQAAVLPDELLVYDSVSEQDAGRDECIAVWISTRMRTRG
jgi:hypothetical protein